MACLSELRTVLIAALHKEGGFYTQYRSISALKLAMTMSFLHCGKTHRHGRYTAVIQTAQRH